MVKVQLLLHYDHKLTYMIANDPILSEDVMHKVGQIGRLLVIVPKGQVKSYFQSKLLKSLVWIEQIIYRSDESWLTRYFDDFWSKIWRSGLYYYNRTSATYNYKVFVARWWRISGGWHIFVGWRISEKEINFLVDHDIEVVVYYFLLFFPKNLSFRNFRTWRTAYIRHLSDVRHLIAFFLIEPKPEDRIADIRQLLQYQILDIYLLIDLNCLFKNKIIFNSKFQKIAFILCNILNIKITMLCSVNVSIIVGVAWQASSWPDLVLPLKCFSIRWYPPNIRWIFAIRTASFPLEVYFFSQN